MLRTVSPPAIRSINQSMPPKPSIFFIAARVFGCPGTSNPLAVAGTLWRLWLESSLCQKKFHGGVDVSTSPAGGRGRPPGGGGILADLPWFCSLFAVRSRNPLISFGYEVLAQDLDTVLGYQNTSWIREIGGRRCVVLVRRVLDHQLTWL